MSLEPEQKSALLQAARDAAQVAYCPYSRFPVGAAVLAGNKLYRGCNIENSSYGHTICAERVAIFHAVSSGVHSIDAIAITCPEVSRDAPPDLKMPCGACRQVMAEFGAPDFLVIVDG